LLAQGGFNAANADRWPAFEHRCARRYDRSLVPNPEVSPMSPASGPQKAWGGVFREPTDARVEAFSESISFDRRLADDDIDGSIAHARMLASVGLLSVHEADAVAQALEEIRGEIRAGRFEFSVAQEDIHLHIESALTARLGDTGRKLHTARSRNDQVATDLRLYCRRAIDRLDLGLAELQKAFLTLAERERELSQLAAETRRMMMSLILVERASRMRPKTRQERKSK